MDSSLSPPAPPGARDTSWAARYGQAVLAGGIATLPQALFAYQGALALAAQEVWFIAAVLAAPDPAGQLTLSLKALAAQARTDLKWLRELRGRLETKGYLVVTSQHDGSGRQLPNRYDFSGLFARLETCLHAEPLPANPIAEDGSPALPEGGADSSFVARFGRVLARSGIAAIPRGLFVHQAALGLSAQQLWFIAYILSYKWTAALPYPSLHKMAARTGYSRRQIQNIKDSLVAAGYLTLVPRYSPEVGQTTNGYDFSGLLQALGAYAPAPAIAPPAPTPGLPPVVASPRRGRRAIPAGGGQDSPGGGSPAPAAVPADPARPDRFPVGGVVPTPGGGVQTAPGGEVVPVPGGGVVPTPGGGVQTALGREGHPTPRRGVYLAPGGGASLHRGGGAAAPAGGGPAAPGRGVAPALEEGGIQEAGIQEADSNPIPRGGGGTFIRRESPAASPYIAGVVGDYSRELADGPQSAANITRALRLWAHSGLGEEAFVACLHEARRRVRLYQGRQGLDTIHNRMGYLFRVLEDLTAPAATMPPGGGGGWVGLGYGRPLAGAGPARGGGGVRPARSVILAARGACPSSTAAAPFPAGNAGDPAVMRRPGGGGIPGGITPELNIIKGARSAQPNEPGAGITAPGSRFSPGAALAARIPAAESGFCLPVPGSGRRPHYVNPNMPGQVCVSYTRLAPVRCVHDAHTSHEDRSG